MKEECALIYEIQEWFSTYKLPKDLPLGKWFALSIPLDSFPKTSFDIRCIAVPIPKEGKGALETFLLDAFSESSDSDKILVEKAKNFIGSLPDEPYLNKPRLRPKACLGSVLSVFSPDWVFSELHQRLTLIPWEKILEVHSAYKELAKI